MNPCNHLASNLEFPTEAILEIKRSLISDTWQTPDPGECDQQDYTHKWTEEADHVKLGLGIGYWTSHLGLTGVLKQHPYLPLGTDLFREKIAELDQMAMEAMIPELEGKFSLPVFLGEFRDIRSLLKYVIELYTKLRFMELLMNAFRKPLREISDHWLSAVFGWLPFVRDIKTIIQRFSEMEEKFFQFFVNANKRQTLHYEKRLSPETFQNLGWFTQVSTHVCDVHDDLPYAESLFEAIAFDIDSRKTVENLKFCATMEFEYRIPSLESFWTHLAAAFDYWGVNFSPSDIWALVPFSFVVDWVVGIGPWLEQFDSKNLSVQVVIYDYCHSIKYDYRHEEKFIGITEMIDSNGVHLLGDWTAPIPGQAVHTVKAYWREPGVPALDQKQALEWGLPEGWTLVSAAALGVSLFSNGFLAMLEKRRFWR